MAPHPPVQRRWLLAFLALVLAVPPAAAAQGDVRAAHSEPVIDLSNQLVEAIDSGNLSRIDAAFYAVRDAVEAFDPVVEDHHRAAIEAVFNAQPETAQRIADAAVDRFSGDGEAYLLRAWVHLQRGWETEMWADLRTGLLHDPGASARIEEFWNELIGPTALLGPRPSPEIQHRCNRFNAILRDARDTSDAPTATLELFLGLSLAVVERPVDAAPHLRAAIDLDPEGSTLSFTRHQEIVEALRRGIGYEGAAAIYGELDEEHRTAVIALALAMTLTELGDIDSAAAILREASGNPAVDDGRLRRVLGTLFEEVADKCMELGADERLADARTLYGEGAVELGRVLGELPPDASPDERMTTTFDMGRMLSAAAQPEQAIERLRTAHAMWSEIRSGPAMPILFQLGKAYMNLGEPDRAEVYFRQFQQNLEDEGSSDFEALEYLGDIHLENREYDRAQDVLERALELVEAWTDGFEHVDRIRVKLARTLVLNDRDADPKSAIILLRDVTGRDPATRLLLARAHLVDKDPEEALHILRSLRREAEVGDSGSLTPLWRREGPELMARALHGVASHAEARVLLDELCDAHHGDAELHRLRAEVLSALGEDEQAWSDFKQVLRHDRQDPNALAGLANLRLRQVDSAELGERLAIVEDAIALYEQAGDTIGIERAGLAQREVEMAIESKRDRSYAQVLVSSLIVTITLFVVVAWTWIRRKRAALVLGEVVDLERWLRSFLRGQVGEVWQGNFSRLEKYKGRFNYSRYAKMVRDGDSPDVLEPAAFGELVAVVDLCWTDLGVADYVKPGLKKMVLTHLRYVADCRGALAHHQEIYGVRSGAANLAIRRSAAATHMTESVRGSIRFVKNHLLSRSRAGIHVLKPMSQARVFGIAESVQLPVVAGVLVNREEEGRSVE